MVSGRDTNFCLPFSFSQPTLEGEKKSYLNHFFIIAFINWIFFFTSPGVFYNPQFWCQLLYYWGLQICSLLYNICVILCKELRYSFKDNPQSNLFPNGLCFSWWHAPEGSLRHGCRYEMWYLIKANEHREGGLSVMHWWALPF